MTLRRLRYRITSILLLMSAIGIGLSITLWIGERRLRNSNALEAKFSEMGVADSRLSFFGSIKIPDTEKVNPTLMDRLLGNTKIVRSPAFRNIEIGQDAAAFLSDSIATSTINEVSFSETNIATNARCFLNHWESLKKIEFYNVAIPESWKLGIIENRSLESLTIALGSSGFSLDDLKRLTSLKRLVMYDLNINFDRQTRESLVQALPNTDIYFDLDF